MHDETEKKGDFWKYNLLLSYLFIIVKLRSFWNWINDWINWRCKMLKILPSRSTQHHSSCRRRRRGWWASGGGSGRSPSHPGAVVRRGADGRRSPAAGRRLGCRAQQGRTSPKVPVCPSLLTPPERLSLWINSCGLPWSPSRPWAKPPSPGRDPRWWNGPRRRRRRGLWLSILSAAPFWWGGFNW